MELESVTFRTSQGVGMDKKIKNWRDQFKGKKRILIEKIVQSASDNSLYITILYYEQELNINVTEEEVAPESVTDLKVTKFTEGKTINFNLFLKETEIEFLKNNSHLLCNGIGTTLDCYSKDEDLIMLRDLREKGMMFTYKNHEEKDVFKATIVCEYFNDNFLSQ